VSSVYVRSQVASFIATNLPTENVVDLTGVYDDLQDVLSNAGLVFTDHWLGIQYIGNMEEPIGINTNNTKGCYREVGAIALHVVEPSKLGVANPILTRAETIINSFRGQRIGDILITALTPPNFEKGTTIEFESGYSSASILIEYEKDLHL